ncbi:MAG TPA: STAS domain-containing protein [Patescibacteria group bacterium]|nr:STAS domain-containing protein [Patescibacteria group bacterium]
MKYNITNNNGAVQVGLEGSLNFAANEEFHVLLDSVVKLAPRSVVFNLSSLSGIDSVGLGLLYIAQEDLAVINAKLSLASPREGVSRLLELTEANKTFEILA